MAMGLRGQTEVQGIFSSAIPASLLYSHTDPEGRNETERQRPPCAGAIPDARFNIDGSNKLMDLKCIHLCRSNYWPTRATAQRRGGALTRREGLVPQQYTAAARKLDARIARTRGGPPPPGVTTVEAILSSYDPVWGLVFGSTACGGSKQVGDLLLAAASSASERQWRMMGARTSTEAYSFYVGLLRRQWGFAAARAHAQLRLARLERLGHAGRAATRQSNASLTSVVSATIFQAGLDALGAGGGRTGFEGGGRMEYSGLEGRD